MGKQNLQAINKYMESGIGGILELRKLRFLFLPLKKIWSAKRKRKKKEKQIQKHMTKQTYRRHGGHHTWGKMRQMAGLFASIKKFYF